MYTLPPTGSTPHPVTSIVGLDPRRTTVNFACGFQSLVFPDHAVDRTRP